MRKVVLMAVVLMASIMTVTAQQRQRNDKNPQQRLEKQIERLDEKLNLTDEQAKQVKAIYEEFYKQQSSSREACRSQRKEMNDKIESLLTEEQKKIYESIKKERNPAGRKRNKR